MERIQLEAQYRSKLTKGSNNQLRRQGYATGSIFGYGAESVPIAIKFEDLANKIKHSPAGITSLIDLKVKDAPENYDSLAIIKDFTKDPITHRLIDVEFQKVSMKEKIHVAVPVELVGDSLCARAGGTVEEIVNELEVECTPDHIPAKIEVDISRQKIGDVIRVQDIHLGEDVELMANPDDVIISCIPPRVVMELEEEEEFETEMTKTPEVSS